MRTIAGIVMLSVVSSHASAQNLMERTPGTAQPTGYASPLMSYSLFSIRPPEPKTYKVHDLVKIIVNENSSASSDHTFETTKETSSTASINAMVDPLQLLEARLRAGSTTDLDLLDVEADREFKGEGEMERADRIIDRITAEVVDVKPNGTIVLEARRVMKVDSETKTLLVTGMCSAEDITRQGTIQSNELANLTVTLEHEGELKKASQKGIITRALDTLFAF